MTTAQQVQVAAKLYECRDAARTLLGANYAARMRDWGRIIRAVASNRKCSELAAANQIADENSADGFRAIVILAAAVELLEPIEQESGR